MKKFVVILSGGLDSTVVLYHLKNQGFEIVGVLSFDYGQKHKKELIYAKRTCEKLKLAHKIVDLTSITNLLDSTLTSKNQKIPEGYYTAENMKQTVVPNRNMIMLSIATGYAISKKADYIALGVHQGDHTIYPDCREEFIEKLNQAVKIADWHKVEILTPLLKLNKSQIVKLGIKEKVPFENTWTCYKGLKKSCGKCGSCRERSEAFAKNKIRDPLS